ncbi:hypothetical protein [Clostridium tagluense]|uniref:hypothetical protein n=1 Tax=Clostridium tagluense TaxID=360422 RepID=UPI001CF3FD05|nr:hypothetical protein [Clostridium tagluense]MCB2297811.1 hypothetical protein [Clostridium tagluense]
MEYKILNPETFEEDEKGLRYSIEIVGSSKIISLCPLIDETTPIEPPVLVIPQPTLEDKINYLYYKDKGMI